MDNGILIGLAMVAGGTMLGVANSKWRAWRGRHARAQGQNGRPDPPPIALSSLGSREIKYYPGVPTGYVGYTDRTIMNVVLNDGLIGRAADEQYMLIGFGEGFSRGMLERIATVAPPDTCTFRIESGSENDMQCLGWLSRMQEAGTDNAPPSTENLQRVISKVSRDLTGGGPVTMKFWHKVHSKEIETPQGSGTSPAELDSLREKLDLTRSRGAQLALEATLIPLRR